MEDNTQPGAIIDTRPESEKERDFRFEEIVASAAPVEWEEKSFAEMRKFPIFDQAQSGSCVAQTGKKMLGVYVQLKTGEWVDLSASHIYKRRANRPHGGMAGVDCFNIMRKGTTLEVFAPSVKMNDAKMDAVEVNAFEENIGKAFSIGNFLTVASKDIDLVASIIQETKKAVMVWFYFGKNEWKAVPVVVHNALDLYASTTSRHSVAAVDFTLLGKKNVPKNPELWGKKALLIEDSWGPDAGNGAGQRLITEDFFRARNWFSAHFMNFAFELPADPVNPKPKHTFLRDLEFSATFTTDPEVAILQECLKWEGCFPSNVESTGYFGAVTRKAVETFQVKHTIAGPGDLGFGRVGPKTRSKLNYIFA